METGKNEKTANKQEHSRAQYGNPCKEVKWIALVAGVVIAVLAGISTDWMSVGIYSGCNIPNRLIYPFFHANILHALLNIGCWLSLLFIYDITVSRLLLAYAIAILVPIDTLGMAEPTVGLSTIIFVLFGSISFQVQRRWYYQTWMSIYLFAGFLLPGTNAWLHLYGYLAGVVVAVLNKPIKSRRNGR